MTSDERFMRLALRLAAKAKGQTRPNPMVGAVVVARGRIVGKGVHRRAGQPHAEVMALRQAGPKTKGATLYVSLEPCHHFGRTPPCTQAIVRAGIGRVVAAMIDPNPKNRGRGVRFLRSHGIQTRVGVLEKQAQILNEVFVTWMKTKRPFVTVKVAQSLDGKIATRTGESRWISGPAARRWVHRLRSQVDAILVGVGTVLKDDPRLTVRIGPLRRAVHPEHGSKDERLAQGERTIRVILDSELRTPPKARIFSSGSPVLIATSAAVPRSREEKLRRAGAEVLRLPSRKGRVDVKALLKALARREVLHLLIEGGGEVIASAFEAHVVDRIAFIVTAKIIGGRKAPTAVDGEGIASLAHAIPLKNIRIQPLGFDLLVTADVHRHR